MSLSEVPDQPKPAPVQTAPAGIPLELEPQPQSKPKDNAVDSNFGLQAFRTLLANIRLILGNLFGSRSVSEEKTGEFEGMSQTAGENGLLAETAADDGQGNVQDFNPVPNRPDSSPESSKEIFWEIGQRLRKRREMLSLTLEEIERHIHVRAVFLNSLEHGVLDDLPSPVQTRGMLANYASFIDLDVDAIMLRFAEGLQAQYRERHPEPAKRRREPMTVNTSLPPLRSFIVGDLLFGGGMVIMLVLFAIWGVNRILTVRSQSQPLATAPSISQVLEGTPLPTLSGEVTLIPAEADTLLAPTLQATTEVPTLPANINVQLNIEAVGRTYLRVTVDGKVQFEGRVIPGMAYPYDGQNQIDVLVGNAAALRITYNGRDLGLMGNFGEVIDRVYTSEGVATPTFTPQPTATQTPKVTATPTEEPTSTPTPTPGE